MSQSLLEKLVPHILSIWFIDLSLQDVMTSHLSVDEESIDSVHSFGRSNLMKEWGSRPQFVPFIWQISRKDSLNRKSRQRKCQDKWTRRWQRQQQTSKGYSFSIEDDEEVIKIDSHSWEKSLELLRIPHSRNNIILTSSHHHQESRIKKLQEFLSCSKVGLFRGESGSKQSQSYLLSHRTWQELRRSKQEESAAKVY